MKNKVAKAKDLRKKSEKELMELVKSTKKDLEKVVSDLLKGKQKDIKKPGKLKKDIARLITLVNEKKILSEAK